MKGKTPDVMVHVALFFVGGDHVTYSCKRSRRHVIRARMHAAYKSGGIKAARTYRDFLAALLPENR